MEFVHTLSRDTAWLFLFAFLSSLAEALMVTVGEWWFHAGFRTTNTYERLIIQVTTLGKEYDRVCEIISRIRAYNLPMAYEVWVVVEPFYKEKFRDEDGNKRQRRVETRKDYHGADKVIVVPEEFKCLSTHKARAQEYSRRVREELGLAYDATLKLLFLDDDVEPTREYVITGFVGDYDVSQGITSPRVHYGNHNFGHFLLSHMDDIRFLACFVWCSFTQGVIKRPIYTHGEGLFLTARAEREVTWNYPIYASEDLVVGLNAAHLGLSWGWFHEYIELTSPWTWGDYIKQRRRWLWGNIHAIITKGVLPTWGRILVAGKYVLGIAIFALSLLGTLLLVTGVAHFSPMTYVFCWGSFIAWTISFAVSGWVNSGRREPGDMRGPVRFTLRRLFQSAAAVFLAVTLITPGWTTLALLIALFKGKPDGFEVIQKTAKSPVAASN